MNLDWVRWPALGLGIVLGLVAVIAGTNEAVAVPFASLAILSVGVFGALSLIEQVRFHLPTIQRPSADTLVALRQAFREGAIGRQRIAQALLELERETLGRASTQDGDPTALYPESATETEFRRWVVAHLERLERST